jgi:hypothetical protein
MESLRFEPTALNEAIRVFGIQRYRRNEFRCTVNGDYRDIAKYRSGTFEIIE